MRRLAITLACAAALAAAGGGFMAYAQQALPAETPAQFKPTNSGYDYDKRDVMIPMRDGVKLHAVLIVPNGSKGAPIILDRTPYDASKGTSATESAHASMIVRPAFAELLQAGYIVAIEDVRGKYGSQGDYVMNRPVRGPLNPTQVDHATDAYDTIDWLVKNVPESNGRVGTIGVSYDGFTVTQSLIDPHPALKAAVPINPMIDGWTGDDWFHNGAFRQEMMSYIYEQEATRKNDNDWPNSAYDDYDFFLKAGSAGALGRKLGMEQLGFWQKITQHPSYDDWWRGQAVDKILAARPLKVPTLWVASLWDQEDIYGALAAYAATEAKDTRNDMNFLVVGPWNHGGSMRDGSSLGPLKFEADTALWFRKHILIPFLDANLKNNAPKLALAPVTAFQTGANEWRSQNAFPMNAGVLRAFLQPNGGLSFEAPSGNGTASDAYDSDPAKPVPYRVRPNRPTYADDSTWRQWLIDDQRPFSDRPDVLTYTSPALAEPYRVQGRPVADLFAATSGTDADFVVKLIDVYPDEVPGQPQLGGYQLPIAMDIFRGRYREDVAVAKPLKANAPLEFRFALPAVNHVFLPGHRIMVQIQSSWFPLYDRNPQTFTPNIFFADPTAYRKQTHRIFRGGALRSAIELPTVR